jgi:lincosamide nucleotidyltransferase A/C/D/E
MPELPQIRNMTSTEVINLYEKLEGLEIKIWIDGGWAVDALLGEQTRAHEDLDVAIERKNLPKLREYLEAQGYKEIERDADKKWDLVMGDEQGYEIEVHAFEFNSDGQVVEEKCWDGYSADSLAGTGVIDGQAVRCVSLDHLFKTKRNFKESDAKDIAALCQKFGVEYPEKYKQKPGA